jgi:hypothetical protein
MLKKIMVTLSTITLLNACSSPTDIQHYSDLKPNLTIQHYFNGRLQTDGLLLDQNKNVVARFTRKTKGTWKNDDGYLTEVTHYTNGKQSYREWCIHMIDAHHFTGISTDVVGTLHGEQFGNTIHIHYQLTPSTDISDNLPLTKLQKFIGLLSGSPTTKNSPENIGEFCSNVKRGWGQNSQASARNLQMDAWLFAINRNAVLEHSTIRHGSQYIGEIMGNIHP